MFEHSSWTRTSAPSWAVLTESEPGGVEQGASLRSLLRAADTGAVDWIMLTAVLLALGGVVLGFMEDIDAIRRDAERS